MEDLMIEFDNFTSQNQSKKKKKQMKSLVLLIFDSF